MASKSPPKRWIEGKIKGKRVVVFSKTTCPFCKRAKSELKEYVGKEKVVPPDEYEVIEINRNPDGIDCGVIQTHLMKMTGAKTVPRVFINGKSIGGSDVVHDLHRTGQLKAMLQEEDNNDNKQQETTTTTKML